MCERRVKNKIFLYKIKHFFKKHLVLNTGLSYNNLSAELNAQAEYTLSKSDAITATLGAAYKL